MVLMGVGAAARNARRGGLLTADGYKRFRSLLWANPVDGDGVCFRDRLYDEVLAAAAFIGCPAVSVGPEGPIIDSLIDLLNWIVENWEVIAQVILFLISLFGRTKR